MQVAYFIHDATDAAVHKRVKMLRAGGASVSAFGFTRGPATETDIEGAPAVIFGQTFDRRLVHRITSALTSILKLGRHREVLSSADVILARNLEVLAVAAAARKLYAPNARLVYECLDIHPLMLREDVIGRALRALERAILSSSQLIVTSSPSFKTQYFETRQHLSTPVLLLENKVLRLDGRAQIASPRAEPGPPWRIGWYGIHRTQKALDIICEIAKNNPNLVEFVIRGRPGLVDFKDFHGQIADTPGVTFDGTYGPGDLERIYADVHFNWAFDFFDEDFNSAWLLPNRIYEGGLYGGIPLAKRNNETGQWLAAHGVGDLMDDPGRELPIFLKNLTSESYVELASRSQRLPVGDVVADVHDCEALTAALKGEDRKAIEEDRSLMGEDVIIVIPTLNEGKHLASVINTLRQDQASAKALIIVADGGSKDDTIAITQAIGREDPRVVAIPTDTPLGISASVNKAVHLYGKGRGWLVRIDAHAEYPPNYPSRLVTKAKEMGANSVVTPMITKGANCFQRATAAASNSVLGTGGAAHRMPGKGGWVDHGHHALFKLDLFDQVGGYDEGFTHNEDAELDHRLRKASGRIWLEDALAIVYYPRSTPKALFGQYFKYGAGRARTIARHGGSRHLRQVIPLAIPLLVLLALAAPIYPLLALPAILWVAACMGYGLLLFRPEDPCAGAAGFPAMIMHLAWPLGYWSQKLKGPERAPLISVLKSSPAFKASN